MKMSEKTLNLIGDKEIKVKSFNKTHIRITVMLIILGNGKSLPPFVVFMGKPKGTKETKFRKHPKVLSGDIYVSCQEKSSVDENTMKTYLKKFQRKYL